VFSLFELLNSVPKVIDPFLLSNQEHVLAWESLSQILGAPESYGVMPLEVPFHLDRDEWDNRLKTNTISFPSKVKAFILI